MKRILVASDLSERSDHAIRRAVRLAEAHGASVTVAYVVDSALPAYIAAHVQKQATITLQTKLNDCVPDPKLKTDIQVPVGDVVTEVGEVAEQVMADLLILGVHRRRLFFDKIKETTMERLIRHSRQPVLAVVNPAEAPYAHLLAAVDLSPACARAVRLAKALLPQARIGLFHAHDVSFHKEAERDYATWLAVAGLDDDLPPPMFVEARPVDAVDQIMKDNDHDLLVMGAHTRSNVGRFLLGGFSSDMIRNPPSDILVAK
ncbi:universal stress protein [Yoonia sp. 2307UL14-13]|uniref:universal stress protein n=1 Tax=Yoonia sp. 2307UL14-13 TaxID=3126506 RepID=UPI00309FC012